MSCTKPAKLEFNIKWNIIFCHCEGINPVAREGFNPSDKNKVCQEAGKNQADTLDFP